MLDLTKHVLFKVNVLEKTIERRFIKEFPKRIFLKSLSPNDIGSEFNACMRNHIKSVIGCDSVVIIHEFGHNRLELVEREALIFKNYVRR